MTDGRKGGPIAQRLEQGTHNPLVPGSNPGGPSRAIFGPAAVATLAEQAFRISIRTRGVPRRLLAILEVVVLSILNLATRCANCRQVFVGGEIYFTDADCYARMTRVRLLIEHPGSRPPRIPSALFDR